MQRKLIQLVAMACLVAGLAVPAHAQNGARVVVDGNMWLQSPAEVRKAFIVGAGNMMALETSYARKNGTTPPPASTRAVAALEHLTLDQISNRITSWYAANPDRRSTPVIGVMWMDMIVPSTAGR